MPIYGTTGNDDIIGTRYADNIYAGSGHDWINGTTGADYMYGEAGDDVFWWDVLDGTGGAVGLIHGGSGYDLVDMSNFSDSYIIYNDTQQYVRAGMRYYQITAIEEIWLNDAANAMGTPLGIIAAQSPLSIFMGGGNDYAALAGAVTVNGEDGNDVFRLTGVINAGFDINASVYGGSGYDRIIVGAGFTVDLYEGTALSGDSVYHLDSIEDVTAFAGFNAAESTVIYGNDVANRFIVGTDNASATGLGVEFYGYGGNDLLAGTRGQDLLEGGSGTDKLLGYGGDDTLRGGDTGDIIDGGSGNDYIHGGAGRDLLTGGTGADDFVFLTWTDSYRTLAAADLIRDFRHSEFDLIDLSALDAAAGYTADDAFDFIGQAAFSGTRGELRYTFINGETIVQADYNGDSVADMMIRLTGQIDLVADDFVL